MHFIDADYIRLAAQLQNHCITISAKCLDSVPLEAEGEQKNKFAFVIHFFFTIFLPWYHDIANPYFLHPFQLSTAYLLRNCAHFPVHL